MREIRTQAFNSDELTDENVLYRNKLVSPTLLSKNITYLYGKDSDRFPLLSMTEGQGFVRSVKPKELNDSQYEWAVMGLMKHTTVVYGLVNSSITAPGLNFTQFDVEFSDDWTIKDYGLVSPDGLHRCRIQGEPQKQSNGRTIAKLVLESSDPTEFVSLGNFTTGRTWVLAAPKVAMSRSDGNKSHSMTPGKMTNQFSSHRYSKGITGNIANKAVVFELDTEDGGKTNMWMPFEMKQFELDRRFLNEEDLWYSKYNRDANGVITMKDPETGEPIPSGAGVEEVLKTTGQFDTYNPVALTKAKLDQTVVSIFSNRIDSTPMEIVLYTGKGGLRAFHNALLNDASSQSLFLKLSEQVIGGTEGYMTYGNYFTQYRTIDGYLLTIRECNLFNHGTLAEQDRAEGRMVDGLPLTSYNLVFLDHSMNDAGERNIEIVCESGREVMSGIYKGLTPLPDAWKIVYGKQEGALSTRRDEAFYEVLDTQGLAFRNWTTSFWLAPSV